MKRNLLTLIAVLLTATLTAQPKPRQELKNNVPFSASNCLAYTGPTQRKLTKAPDDKRPFYLSHYGRHGSRYLINSHDYHYVLDILAKADRLGKLTALGKDVLRRVTIMEQDATDRLGDLTELGVSQQKAIARRMVERFPELFEGEAQIDARSTLVLRCVFSMENALQQMLSMNPRLRIDHSANRTDMHILNFQDKELLSQINSIENRDAYDKYCRRHECWQRPVSKLFTDSAYLNRDISGERLNYYLFRMAGSVQNTELRSRLTLYDLFTDDEIYQNWQKENVYWFLGYGSSPLTGNHQPYTQRHLLRRIIEQADSSIALERPGIHLRWGHETCLLPLVCLMNINGYGQPISDLNQLEKKNWVNYRIFPMSANVQLVFYRRDPSDKDVLVKILLNENEATLPDLKSDFAPYYRWADVRDYFLKKLDAYPEPQQ